MAIASSTSHSRPKWSPVFKRRAKEVELGEEAGEWRDSGER